MERLTQTTRLKEQLEISISSTRLPSVAGMTPLVAISQSEISKAQRSPSAADNNLTQSIAVIKPQNVIVWSSPDLGSVAFVSLCLL